MKPGWKTSEFWVTLISKLVGVLVALGVFSASQGADWQTASANATVGVFAIISLVGLAKSYVEARTELKKNAQT